MFIYAAPAIGSFLGSTFTLGYVVTSSGALVAITVTGTQIAAAGAAAAVGLGILFARRTGKESSSDKPSWVNRDMVDFGLSPQENAQKILDTKYGPNNWPKGAGTEFNKIVKWIVRKIFFRG